MELLVVGVVWVVVIWIQYKKLYLDLMEKIIERLF